MLGTWNLLNEMSLMLIIIMNHIINHTINHNLGVQFAYTIIIEIIVHCAGLLYDML